MDNTHRGSRFIALCLICSLIAINSYPKDISMVLSSGALAQFHVENNAIVYTATAPQADTTAPWSVMDFSFADMEIPGTADEQGNLDVEYVIRGLSEEGRKKLKKRKKLILPNAGKDNKTPVWISEGAFANLEIDEVVVPGNYTHIQFSAFAGSKIKRLVLEEGVTFVNKNAFENNEIEELILPQSFRYAAKAAFKGNKIKKLVLPKKVEIIGEEAFMDNEIEELEFRGSINHIYERAFAGNKLTEVNIPLSLRNVKDKLPGIHQTAFDNNPGVPSPKNPSENKVLLWTPNRDNPFKLLSKGNFLVDALTRDV